MIITKRIFIQLLGLFLALIMGGCISVSNNATSPISNTLEPLTEVPGESLSTPTPSQVSLYVSSTPSQPVPSSTPPPSMFTQTIMPTSQEPIANQSTPMPSPVFPAISPTLTQQAPSLTQPATAITQTPITTSQNQENIPANGPTATLPAPTPGVTACTNQASFEGDVTVPDNTVFQPGQQFVKTWRLYNSGTCTWGNGYSVVFAYGDLMAAPQSTTIPQTAPGGSIQVSLNMTAPSSPGQHAGNWKLQNANGEQFGVGTNGNDYFWAQIMVSYASTPTPSTSNQSDSSTPALPTAQGTPSPNQTTTLSPTTINGCTYSSNSDYENEILNQINAVRISQGLNSLTLQNQLAAAARTYSIDMACNNRVDFTHHTDSNGGRWYQRISAQGYDYAAAFENVFVGNPAYSGTPQAAMNWWMNSPIHRANILNPDVSQIGIAYIFTSTSDYGGYYTVDFAQPK